MYAPTKLDRLCHSHGTPLVATSKYALPPQPPLVRIPPLTKQRYPVIFFDQSMCHTYQRLLLFPIPSRIAPSRRHQPPPPLHPFTSAPTALSHPSRAPKLPVGRERALQPALAPTAPRPSPSPATPSPPLVTHRPTPPHPAVHDFSTPTVR